MMDAPANAPDPSDNPAVLLEQIEQRANAIAARDRRAMEVNAALQVVGLFSQRGTTAVVREVEVSQAWTTVERAAYDAALRLLSRAFMEGL